MSADYAYAKYYELRYKKSHLLKFVAFARFRVKICVISGVRFERRKVDKS